jgi:putative hydrolase of the HAD superfamily
VTVVVAGKGELARFASVDTWVFDLDNTLYPASTALFPQIEVKMRTFVARLLDLDEADARALQKQYYRRYGTTLRGLMTEHGVAPLDFLAFVHDIDHSALVPDHRLAEALARLPGKRYIMTSGSRTHASAVASRLAIEHHFDDVFDIIAADYIPKPAAETYDRFWTATGIRPERAAMFEDLARNLETPHAFGMRTVLVVPPDADGSEDPELPDWEREGRTAAYIDHITDDLAGFLERVLEVIGAPAPASDATAR